LSLFALCAIISTPQEKKTVRYTQPLDDLFGSQAKVRILRYLCSIEGEHTGREIARAIGMGETPVHRALQELADTMVVLYRVVGHTHYYRLNQHHVLAERLLCPLFAAEQGQRDAALAELLAEMDVPLDAALIYGSVARGEDSWHSDLDILLVTPTADDTRRTGERIWQRDGDLLRRYGPVSVWVLSRDELDRRIQDGEQWLAEALRDGGSRARSSISATAAAGGDLMSPKAGRRAAVARVRSVGVVAWHNYLQRAQQTLRAMQRSAAEEDWAAVAAIAPTCAIAAADAVVARMAGVVARDEDHAAAVELLLAHGSKLDGVEQATQHLRRLLERKTEVQYGNGVVTASSARDMLTHAERLLDWAEKVLADQ
jgi:predicted nucleotidyltransferase